MLRNYCLLKFCGSRDMGRHPKLLSDFLEFTSQRCKQCVLAVNPTETWLVIFRRTYKDLK